MLENLCKKEKTLYTKELLKNEMLLLAKERDDYRGKSLYDQVIFERAYIKERIHIIREAIKKEVDKTIKRVSSIHELDADYIKMYAYNLRELNAMWLATSDKLEMAVDEEFDLNTLIKASDDICEMACSMDNKDFRTYNMLPVWEVEKQTLGLPSAIQNYELVIDDYLNTLGSYGMKKFRKDLDGYAMRENIDSKFEKYLEKSVKDPSAVDLAMKCIEEGAYVDLKLEGDGFLFSHKPCTALSYLLMQKNKDAVVTLLKHGANVNIKITTEHGETFIPIVYALENNVDSEIINLILDNGARLDRTFLGINVLERALQVKNNSLIMRLLNNGIGNYKESSNIAKLVKNYLRESRDERVIVGLYDNDMISLEDMLNLSKENDNEVLAGVAEGLMCSFDYRTGSSKKTRRKIDKEVVKFSKIGLKDGLRITKDMGHVRDTGLVSIPKNKNNYNISQMYNSIG